MMLKFINRFWHLLFVLLEVLLLILVMFWLMVTPMVAENIVYVLLPLVFVVLLIIFIVKRIRNIFAKKSEVPSEITVPDDCVVCLPEFNVKLDSICNIVPDTINILFLFKSGQSMSKEFRYWAMDMMENGFQTPGITQLAGEELNMNPFEFKALFDKILCELNWNFKDEEIYSHYVLYIAQKVLDGEMSCDCGLDSLCNIALPYFHEFDYLRDNISLSKEGLWSFCGINSDNYEEWMLLYFQKVIWYNKLF